MASSSNMLNLAVERFERRLVQDIASLEITLTREMHAGFAAIRQKMADQRVEMFRWSFVFWIGQFAATAGLLAFMLRAR